MMLDKIVLSVSILIGWILVLIIPHDKRRLAWVAFLMKHAMTWPMGLTVVELGLIRYPYRFVEHAHRVSFCFEFFLYPVVCCIFNAYYPTERSRLFKWVYTLAFPTAITIPEYYIEKHTNLIVYEHWTWHWTWITLFITFLMSRALCIWFFRGIKQKNTSI